MATWLHGIHAHTQTKVSYTSLTHYLSLEVKKRLCAREAPVIVRIWILQGSCVHFRSLVTVPLYI